MRRTRPYVQTYPGASFAQDVQQYNLPFQGALQQQIGQPQAPFQPAQDFVNPYAVEQPLYSRPMPSASPYSPSNTRRSFVTSTPPASPGHVPRWQMFPYRLLKPYSAPDDTSDDLSFLNVLDPNNCELFRRPGIGMSFCAQSLQQNWPLVNQYSDSVFDNTFIQDLRRHVEPILPTLGKLNNRDTAAGAPSISDIDTFLQFALQENQDLDNLLIDAIHASSSLLCMSTHLRAVLLLLRNPDLYAQKVSSADHSHVQFATSKSVVDMRQWLIHSILPASATRVRPVNLLQQLNQTQENPRAQVNMPQLPPRRASRATATTSAQSPGQFQSSQVQETSSFQHGQDTSTQGIRPRRVQRSARSTPTCTSTSSSTAVGEYDESYAGTAAEVVQPERRRRTFHLNDTSSEEETVLPAPPPPKRPKNVAKKISATPKRAKKVKAGSVIHANTKTRKGTSHRIVFESDDSKL